MDNASPRAERDRCCRGDPPVEQPRQRWPMGGNTNIAGQSIAPPTAEKKWYIVHTYSGHENKAKLTLLERVKTHNLTEYFGDVLVPTESR